MKCMIYDFETLGQNPRTSPVLSAAFLEYDEGRFLLIDGYDYDDLLDKCTFIKFDVADQVKNHAKVIEKSTLEWWQSQGPEAKKVLKPDPEKDQRITELSGFIAWNYDPSSFDKVFTRGNTFDPIFLANLPGGDPFPWWAIRDTRSYIDGMLIGQKDVDNRFVPDKYKDKFVHHDPRHDVVMDVMRMQELIRAIML